MAYVKRWKTWVTGLTAVALCVVPGCLRMYYPSIAVIPPPPLQETPTDVHVFRVDTCRIGTGITLFIDPEVLTEISGADLCKPQVQVGLTTCEYWFFGGYPVGFHENSGSHLALRLYRPGWKTVQLNSWNLAPTVKWEKAESLSDQEAALEELAFPFELFVSRGSTSPAHCAALLFIIGEWERLGRDFANSEHDHEVQQRLAEKANTFRKLANY